VEPNSYFNMPKPWHLYFGSLSDGKYRITKEVSINNAQRDRVEIIVEFTINNRTVQEND